MTKSLQECALFIW